MSEHKETEKLQESLQNGNRKLMGISVTVFALLFILPWLLWGLFSVLAKEGNTFDSIIHADSGENRNLNKISEDVSLDTFPGEFEAFFNDRVPFRPQMLLSYKDLSNTYDEFYVNKIRMALMPKNASLPVYGDGEFHSETARMQAELISTLPYDPPYIIKDAVIRGRNDWFFYNLNEVPADYTGSLIWSEGQMSYYLTILEQIETLCEQKGIEFVFMVYPNKSQIYPEYMPSYEIEDDYRRIDRFVDYIRANSSIKVVYPRDELIYGKEIYETYLRLDTHITKYGGFIGTQSLYATLENPVPATDIRTLQVTDDPQITGDLLNMAGYAAGDKGTDHECKILYKPEVSILSTIGTNDGETYYSSTSNGVRNEFVAIIGDSYRLRMVPILEKDFSHVSSEFYGNLANTPLAEDIKTCDILIYEALERNTTKEDFESTLWNIIRILEES